MNAEEVQLSAKVKEGEAIKKQTAAREEREKEEMKAKEARAEGG
jgi:hypothetical protein